MASPQIPEMQWAQVFEKFGGPIELKQIPVPKPGSDQVLVNLKYSGGMRFSFYAASLLFES
jgi:propanol-preferring alcohol dehydrogenase